MLSAPHVLPGPCAWPGCPAAGPYCHIACPTCRTPRCWNLDCPTCRRAWIHGQEPPAGDTAPDSQRRTFFYRLLVRQREQVETLCTRRLACVPVQVQRLRKARGLSQRDLARLAVVPHRTLAQLERGRNVTRVPLAVLARLALALEVGLEVLCGYEATPETGTCHHWPLDWQPMVSAPPPKAEGEG